MSKVMRLGPGINLHNVKTVEIGRTCVLPSVCSTHITIISEDGDEFELTLFHEDRILAVFDENIIVMAKPQAE